MASADRPLFNSADRLRDLAYKLPVARLASLAREADIDGRPSGGDGTGRRGTSELTPTEATASRRMAESGARAKLEAVARDITRLVAEANVMADRLTGHVIEVPACDGGSGREGHEQWGDSTCDEVPELGRKMCAKHRGRMNRWRAGRQMEAQDVEA